MIETQDLRVGRVEPLVPPDVLKRDLPGSDDVYGLVSRTRAAVRNIVTGKDGRWLAVVGPCSIHDPEAALDYARRLRALAGRLADKLFVVMRVYFEKPRTVIGWKGLINDPHLNGTHDMQLGLRLARKLLIDLTQLGLPAGTELLDPITPQYLADLISWSAIGARTTESQTHREMASGLSMPVGFKNGTDGGLQVAIDAMVSARHPHTFLGIDVDGTTSAIRTQGNPDRHVVLRGGRARANHHPEDVAHAAALVAEQGIARPLMIDCSHGNSGKDPSRQLRVCREVLDQVRGGQRAIMGLLLESNLVAGRQDWRPGAPLAYGVSITDACVGWDDTEALLHEAAAAVAAARAG